MFEAVIEVRVATHLRAMASPIVVYRNARRAEAARSGLLGHRMEPILPSASRRLFVARDDGRLRVHVGSGDRRDDLVVQGDRVTAVNEVLTSDGRVICADRAAYRGLLSALGADRQLGSKDPRSAAVRRLQALDAAAISTGLVVLTEALAECYWLPAGADARSLSIWGKALEAPPHVESLFAAVEGSGPGFDHHAGYVRNIAAATRTIVRSAPFTGRRSAMTVFRSLVALADGFASHRAVDVHARHEAVASGVSTLGRPLFRTKTGEVTFALSQPCRIKPGKLHAYPSGPSSTLDSLGTVQLRSMTVSDTELLGTFTGGGKLSLLQVLADAESLIFVTPPFSDRSAQTSLPVKRWVTEGRNAEVARVVERDVPLDVVMAGNVGT